MIFEIETENMNKESFEMMKIQETAASVYILGELEEDVFNDI